jgi:hypothetical protein
MLRCSWYAALILAASLSVHRPALAQYSGAGPSGGTTCRPAVPEAGSLTGWSGKPTVWRGFSVVFDNGFRWSPRLSLRNGSLPFFVRRRAGN